MPDETGVLFSSSVGGGAEGGGPGGMPLSGVSKSSALGSMVDDIILGYIYCTVCSCNTYEMDGSNLLVMEYLLHHSAKKKFHGVMLV